ncbi:glycosyl hydrolase family 65 protein [Cytophagaceae bacterium ABcell3]|nr:glycosyl hydrolase family 65 protein [Cytophagaceae bacterium ABcell3]
MSNWKISYDNRDPEEEPLREALCTLGNGYFATRGAAEECESSWPHYHGTYLAGGYNRLESEIAGRTIENEDLVNWPNWLYLTFKPAEGSWLDLNDVKVKSYLQELDLKNGILSRNITFVDVDNRETTLVTRRIVSMADPHLAAIEWTLTPHNWSGKIHFKSAIDGRVTNNGVARYRALSSKHLNILNSGELSEGFFLHVETNNSKIRMAQAARNRIFINDTETKPEVSYFNEEGFSGQELTISCQRGETIRLEKVISLFTSKDFAIAETGLAAREKIRQTGNFPQLLNAHKKAWKIHWNRADIDISGNPDAQRVLRFHIFHLMQVASNNTIDLDVGLPSRGLHGEAYRGHIFWDEIFIFPLLNLRIPELARDLMLYRYRRLGAARHIAQKYGYKGAMYPWQSGSDGREESQQVHLNPLSGEWIPDDTHLQRHVNAAIAYNAWHYYQVSEDKEFLYFYGAEMILEIARFWGSYATYNTEKQKYEINKVVGPDEYHTRYPNAKEAGLNNNAYTNIMAIWCIKCAFKVLDVLDHERQEELMDTLEITQEELDRMHEVSTNMFIPFHNGIISQFEGYEKLEEFDWRGYRKKYDDIQRLDRILGAEGDTPDNYKASKQADVLMLFFLFSKEELNELMEHAGYSLDVKKIPEMVDYYLSRTSHGSTLSSHIHSWVLARTDRERSWQCFKQALNSDIHDIQGGTTHEGIHLGAMAGTIDMVHRCYTGLEVRNDILYLNPRLADQLDHLKVRIRYRGHWIILEVSHDNLKIHLEKGWAGEVKLCVKGKEFTMRTGETSNIALNEK